MTYQSINPFTEAVLRSFPEHTDAELEAVLASAELAFQNDWRGRSYEQRGAVLRRAATILNDRIDHFAVIATREMGKLLREAREEIALCADILRYYADNGEAMLAERPLVLERGEAVVHSKPIGVIFCIEPWNFPYYQLARVAGPNLMAGNTLIVKHAPSVPECALAFEELLREAGAPAGAYSNVFISNEQCANAIADRRVKGVALTGSERAGAAVASEAGKALKKSTMELGGSDAFIVLDDADIDEAVRLAVQGRMNNMGQACAGSKRFILHEAIADAFTRRFCDTLGTYVPGDPMDDQTSLAPLCSLSALERALAQINIAVARGAKVLSGGNRLQRSGYFLAPTVLVDVSPDNPVFRQEFFAPVAMVFRVASDGEAVELANDSPYGLGGSVVTTNIERGKRIAAQMDTGMVFINDTVISAPDLPFGGVKNSGYGRELSDLGIQEFVNRKLVTVTTT
ncbi:NAD-dependent succinate-semialdehyde dehydrogenase [Burkholderia sp. PAMC 26561]|uniref:NAD-dependent succinate-semialdehyde dehydrogenase n=1 Tax=Burkholderia sp. PAMC 26561 TaxID=1795043 RepID=UPI00076AFBAB|nr:NAD-dependent succinate-semialdehyde dehydrogenase [Burkholderia sp. PAMC 26561]AME26939.1 succinate-semialdehyde dehydrogenase [Burkholderia sp. PAMC 26561]AME27915.1 succinate-semialdehyde dehydrogenase [Burkholderia sp. PAMC 26561]